MTVLYIGQYYIVALSFVALLNLLFYCLDYYKRMSISIDSTENWPTEMLKSTRCVCMLMVFWFLELIQKTTTPIAVFWHTEPVVDSPSTAYRCDMKVERWSRFSHSLRKSIFLWMYHNRKDARHISKDNMQAHAQARVRHRERASKNIEAYSTHKRWWCVRAYIYTN